MVQAAATSAILAESGPTPTCFGAEATLTGTLNQRLEGTDGPDVIVTNGATPVVAKGGNDLVCVTGSLPDVLIALGPGDDQLAGSPQDEHVDATDEAPGEIDRDVIETAGGHDEVNVGGADGLSVDIVRLGAGRDALLLEGPAPEATFTGGLARDVLSWAPAQYQPGVAIKIDNLREQLSLSGVVAVRWDSFSLFDFRGPVRGPMTFLGTDQPERLWSSVANRWEFDARMRGGPDIAELSGGASTSRLDGGAGADVLRHSGSAGVIYGRIGNDHLFGGDSNDVLIGGRGYDRGSGAGGIDRCATEVRVSCER